MIKVSNLQFAYNSNNIVLHDLKFSVKKGEIFGFLGPNGSGKSTTQKILMGILPNYFGNVKVNNTDLKKINKHYYEDIGVLFEMPYLYNTLSAVDNLKYFASFYSQKTRDIVQLLRLVGLKSEYFHKQVKHYSKGMKQRTSIARCLVNNPKILFLDEPVSGLDPSGAVLIKNIIRAEKEKGTTIFLTTHNMFVAEQLCDRVAFIVDGEIKALNSPQKLKQDYAANTLEIKYLREGIEEVQVISIEEFKRGIAASFDNIVSINSKQDNLEDVFIKLTGKRLHNG
ncbi:ABC transporter ATP-binding protein [Clostridium sp. 'deep sea']|uniref:ABC transporter ATP-binding protein n=1 Tax=Clostridium sp. 'deep sea' TaxID=2779445 RepID=UPI0018969A7C|nr:ABC transporter ATP-binding protein [Clostridium sp. 'deep sea']QOR34716.1 ABC transporter ATP-binding protein [Clostridium sp. 'deep sea']